MKNLTDSVKFGGYMENDRQILSGKRLRKERECLGLTGEQLGDKIGYTASYISKIENGSKSISVSMLESLSDLFNIRPQYLGGYDDTRTFKDLENQQISENETLLGYFLSIGFSFRPCYVWDASFFAAAMGYQIVAPYLSPNTKLDSGNEFIKFSKAINYIAAVNDEYYYQDLMEELLSMSAYFPNNESAIDMMKKNPFGIFEFSDNPFENANFKSDYCEYENMWLAKERKINDCFYSHGSNYNGDRELHGFLSGSSIGFRYAFSENGILKGYASADDMRRIAAAVKGTSASIIDSMLNP